MKSCLRCGTELVPNPLRRQWHHCPICEPNWIVAIERFHRLQQLDALATFAAKDIRGRPTMGGVRA